MYVCVCVHVCVYIYIYRVLYVYGWICFEYVWVRGVEASMPEADGARASGLAHGLPDRRRGLRRHRRPCRLPDGGAGPPRAPLRRRGLSNMI